MLYLRVNFFFLFCCFCSSSFSFFFFNDTATTEIYTLSLHDALPISTLVPLAARAQADGGTPAAGTEARSEEHTSELQSHSDLVCRLLLEKKKITVAFMPRFENRWSPSLNSLPYTPLLTRRRPCILGGRSAPLTIFFFFTAAATTEIYTLSLHDALPISPGLCSGAATSCSCPKTRDTQSSRRPQ